jgi:hypothetical protein
VAIVPLKQTVTVTSAFTYDDWGNAIAGESTEYKVRIDEGSTVVQTRVGSTVRSEEAKATARLLFDKLAPIGYEDTLTFTNELGETIERTPKEINVKRSVSGKPLLTEVFV